MIQQHLIRYICLSDLMHRVVESDSSTYLKSGMGSGVGFIVVLYSICFNKRRRQGTEKNDQSRSVYFI